MGPVPDKFQSLFEYIIETSEIRIATQTFANGGIGERFELENAENRQGHLTESEAAVLQQVVEKFGSMKTPDLIEKSHQEQAWQANAGQKQWISFQEYGFRVAEYVIPNSIEK
jgi:uncharacterized phage-associated protein